MIHREFLRFWKIFVYVLYFCRDRGGRSQENQLSKKTLKFFEGLTLDLLKVSDSKDFWSGRLKILEFGKNKSLKFEFQIRLAKYTKRTPEEFGKIKSLA